MFVCRQGALWLGEAPSFSGDHEHKDRIVGPCIAKFHDVHGYKSRLPEKYDCDADRDFLIEVPPGVDAVRE